MRPCRTRRPRMQERLAAEQVDLPDPREDARHPLHVRLELREIGEGGRAQVREVRAPFAVEIAVVGEVHFEVVQHGLAPQHRPAKPNHGFRVSRDVRSDAAPALERRAHGMEKRFGDECATDASGAGWDLFRDAHGSSIRPDLRCIAFLYHWGVRTRDPPRSTPWSLSTTPPFVTAHSERACPSQSRTSCESR